MVYDGKSHLEVDDDWGYPYGNPQVDQWTILSLTWIVLKASFPSHLDSLQQTAYIRGPYLSSHTSAAPKSL